MPEQLVGKPAPYKLHVINEDRSSTRNMVQLFQTVIEQG